MSLAETTRYLFLLRRLSGKDTGFGGFYRWNSTIKVFVDRASEWRGSSSWQSTPTSMLSSTCTPQTKRRVLISLPRTPQGDATTGDTQSPQLPTDFIPFYPSSIWQDNCAEDDLMPSPVECDDEVICIIATGIISDSHGDGRSCTAHVLQGTMGGN